MVAVPEVTTSAARGTRAPTSAAQRSAPRRTGRDSGCVRQGRLPPARSTGRQGPETHGPASRAATSAPPRWRPAPAGSGPAASTRPAVERRQGDGTLAMPAGAPKAPHLSRVLPGIEQQIHQASLRDTSPDTPGAGRPAASLQGSARRHPRRRRCRRAAPSPRMHRQVGKGVALLPGATQTARNRRRRRSRADGAAAPAPGQSRLAGGGAAAAGQIGDAGATRWRPPGAGAG